MFNSIVKMGSSSIAFLVTVYDRRGAVGHLQLSVSAAKWTCDH